MIGKISKTSLNECPVWFCLRHASASKKSKITSDILRYIRYSALQCHLAAAFCFIINVAWFIFSDLSSDAWAFSCVYTKRYIIYGQNSQSQEFQQNNLLKSCIGSLVESENCHRTASPPDLAHCAPPPIPSHPPKLSAGMQSQMGRPAQQKIQILIGVLSHQHHQMMRLALTEHHGWW